MRAKSRKNFYLKEDGQLSIFFATNLIVVITLIALVINVGMFVRAKINLQNAVDASAWAGAAVQARQLTNIAYLNWEMRNIYKEWMFKYYVLGNLQIKDVEANSSDPVSFQMSQIEPPPLKDTYNFPSICIEFGNTGGAKICRTYQVPGIPQFGDAGVAAVDQATQAFVNAIEEQKNLDCVKRSNINFLAANLWAYNVAMKSNNAQSLAAAAPNIASDRIGAWPAAFEVALRIRNLEKIVNKRPYSQGVCFRPGASQNISCQQGIETVVGTDRTASNERIYKAFMSGYRTFGITADGGNEMKQTFTLTEIPPHSFLDDAEYSLSNLLIPSGKREKYYLDLKLTLLNLATFYTAFITPPNGIVTTSLGNISTDSGCGATKVALPVPGYPFGFTKNPNVITYYAVKGEADFIGLFNPFNPPSIKLTAFAAAKPFGGRIGPNIFNTRGKGTTTVSSRTTSDKFRSSGYISGLDLTNLVDNDGNIVSGNGAYVPGSPIPGNNNSIDFWVKDLNDHIGGWIDEQNIRFAIPNLVYDYIGGDPTNSEYNSPDKLQIITPIGTGGNPPVAGLYQKEIFDPFKIKLNNLGSNIGANDINEALLAIRAPTLYDAYNYLIPLPYDLNDELKVDSYGEPNLSTVPGHYSFDFFAPLMGDTEDYLYSKPEDIISIVEGYLLHQSHAVHKYRKAMNIVAHQVSQIQTSSGAMVGDAAAKGISDIDFTQPNPEEQFPSCNSMAGRFLFFYLGTEGIGSNSPVGCPQTLLEIIDDYWVELNASTQTKDFYRINYAINFDDTSSDLKNALYSAYRPGPIQGANNGRLTNPYTGLQENMIRNFYSTKLISLRSVTGHDQDSFDEKGTNFPIISEGNNAANGSGDIDQETFENPLNFQTTNWDLNDVNQ